MPRLAIDKVFLDDYSRLGTSRALLATAVNQPSD